MHSGVKPSSYEDTVAKAISNLIDIYRLLKIYTPDIPAVFAFRLGLLIVSLKLNVNLWQILPVLKWIQNL